jgi:hypothetical protein
LAAPSYTTDLTVLDDAADNTGWAEASASGWGSVFAVTSGETDFFIQGSACNSTTVKTGVGALMYNNGSGVTINTDDAFLIWFYWTTPNGLANDANGGIRTVCGNSLSVFYGWSHGGSDTYTYGGWLNLATNPSQTRTYTVGSPNGTWQYFGAGFNASTIPSKGNPFGVDEVSYGRCMAQENDYNDGTNGYNRWGLFQAVSGGYLWKGLITLGYTSAVDFRDSNRSITVDDTPHCSAAFNKISIEQASSRVDWTNISINAIGTKSPGIFTTSVNATINIDACSFQNMGTFTFGGTNSSAINSTWTSCGQITGTSGTFTGSKILTSTVAADTGAFVWNTATDPDTYLDGMTFSKGTNAHHAIDFGTSVTGDIILRNCNFNGFGSTDDSNDSTVRFLATSGSLTLSLIDCLVDGSAATEGNFSVDDAAGITVTKSIAPITELVNVKNTDGDNIENARVFVETAATIASGEMFEASTTSLTQSGGTATCNTTAVHGLITGDVVVIRGAQPDGYNKVATVTVSDTDTFTYSVDSGLTGTATGTPVVSFVVIYGLTNSSGNVSDSRTWGAAQQVKGWARKKNTTSPFYKDGDIAYAIDTSNGNSINVVLQLDE